LSDRITIIGDGAMGTLCVLLLDANGYDVTWWGYRADYMAEVSDRRQNPRYMPGVPVPPAVRVTGDDGCVSDADVIVSAVPCQFVRGVWRRLRPHVPAGLPICSITKGIENDTLLRPTQIITDVLNVPASSVAVLSGPCIAPEVVRRLPAAVVVAGADLALAERVQRMFTTPWFRVYTNPDVIGVELAGATKNVIALAAGIIDGLGAGDNCKAALLTRGLVEITRLGVAMGASRETFAGLAGLGDLVTTCISPIGRNRSAGEQIGRGKTAREVQAATHSVIEGIATTRSVMSLAGRHHVEMPITEAAHRVLFEGQKPLDAIADLMSREPKPEHVHSRL
jgi:glycerol-3-phosphate dehydrogenase (NAD(P)+)